MGLKELPDDERESGKPDTAECGSGSIERGGFAAAHGALKAGSMLLLLLVFFDQRRAGGKDRRKGQEKAAYAGSPVLGD